MTFLEEFNKLQLEAKGRLEVVISDIVNHYVTTKSQLIWELPMSVKRMVTSIDTGDMYPVYYIPIGSDNYLHKDGKVHPKTVANGVSINKSSFSKFLESCGGYYETEKEAAEALKKFKLLDNDSPVTKEALEALGWKNTGNPFYLYKGLLAICWSDRTYSGTVKVGAVAKSGEGMLGLHCKNIGDVKKLESLMQ